MQEFVDDPDFDFKLVATGNHFSETWGRTVAEIERDGFTIDAAIAVELDTSSSASIAASVGEMTREFAAAFAIMQPDMVVVMGDRYELLAIASACVPMTIPISHISGGEITEGAIDDQIRHAMTKMAHLHFVANDVYANRVRQLGEEDWRICVCGEPGLDNVTRLDLLSAAELGRDLGLDLARPTALVTFHPVTLEAESLEDQIQEVTAALIC